MGGAWQEAQLLGIAHAFESATAIRRPPQLAGGNAEDSEIGTRKRVSEEAA
jgi:hypothetical protein